MTDGDQSLHWWWLLGSTGQLFVVLYEQQHSYLLAVIYLVQFLLTLIQLVPILLQLGLCLGQMKLNL